MAELVATVWAIYRSPANAPGAWVLRAHDIRRGQPPQVRPQMMHADRLANIRQALPSGLACIPTEIDYLATLHEVWVPV
jgi:hypothetical protein